MTLNELQRRNLKRRRSTFESILDSSWEFMNNIGCGFASGFFVTGLLNPYDRALFLSLMKKRRFLNIENFREPYHGLTQTLVQRSLSTGLYFPLEDLFLRESEKVFGDKRNNLRLLVAGNFAGILNGLILNPLSYIKYQCWGRNNYSFFSQASIMYRNGGAAVFLRGTVATCLRDGVFGATYSFVRNNDEERKGFQKDVIAAALGTVISSPLNYARNIQFHRNTAKACPNFSQIFSRFMKEVRSEDTILKQVVIVQHRFRIGWGTLRVALGMGIGSRLYSLCHQEL